MNRYAPVLLLGAILFFTAAHDGLSTSLTAYTKHLFRQRSSSIAANSYLQVTRTTKLLNDTLRKVSRIVGIELDASNDVLNIRLELAENQSWIDISLYNMLGKRIKEVYRGPATADSPMRDYSTNVSDLPNGLYIVAIQGSSVRLADKVFISR